jgi:hypothetical protein
MLSALYGLRPRTRDVWLHDVSRNNNTVAFVDIGVHVVFLLLLKYSSLERVAFQLYTLPLKRCAFGTCRVPRLHPPGAKLPRRKCVASVANINALESIANFESDLSRVKVASVT